MAIVIGPPPLPDWLYPLLSYTQRMQQKRREEELRKEQEEAQKGDLAGLGGAVGTLAGLALAIPTAGASIPLSMAASGAIGGLAGSFVKEDFSGLTAPWKTPGGMSQVGQIVGKGAQAIGGGIQAQRDAEAKLAQQIAGEQRREATQIRGEERRGATVDARQQAHIDQQMQEQYGMDWKTAVENAAANNMPLPEFLTATKQGAEARADLTANPAFQNTLKQANLQQTPTLTKSQQNDVRTWQGGLERAKADWKAGIIDFDELNREVDDYQAKISAVTPEMQFQPRTPSIQERVQGTEQFTDESGDVWYTGRANELRREGNVQEDKLKREDAQIANQAAALKLEQQRQKPLADALEQAYKELIPVLGGAPPGRDLLYQRAEVILNREADFQEWQQAKAQPQPSPEAAAQGVQAAMDQRGPTVNLETANSYSQMLMVIADEQGSSNPATWSKESIEQAKLIAERIVDLYAAAGQPPSEALSTMLTRILER